MFLSPPPPPADFQLRPCSFTCIQAVYLVSEKTDNFQPKKKFETGYVLFIGQLAYTTTKDEIWQHFESEGRAI